MIYLDMKFRSEALSGNAQLSLLLPDGAESFKTLWLLHGLYGDHTSWMRNSSIERYAAQYGIAVVMPNAQNSWYADTAYGARYFSLITEELPALLKKRFKGYSKKREDNAIAGLSMGGYGALKAALTYPERYGTAISLSGSLDITRKNRPYSLPLWQGNFGFSLKSADELAGGDQDLFALAKRLADKRADCPRLYAWCGTEDSLLDINDAFDAHLNALGIAHTYETSEGDHSWRYWDEKIRRGLSFAFEE
ncbi:MAG: esterase family protein [Clostridia bacterium]|nr:esterase family protein [Clostridia bacterium]